MYDSIYVYKNHIIGFYLDTVDDVNVNLFSLLLN